MLQWWLHAQYAGRRLIGLCFILHFAGVDIALDRAWLNLEITCLVGVERPLLRLLNRSSFAAKAQLPAHLALHKELIQRGTLLGLLQRS